MTCTSWTARWTSTVSWRFSTWPTGRTWNTRPTRPACHAGWRAAKTCSRPSVRMTSCCTIRSNPLRQWSILCARRPPTRMCSPSSRPCTAPVPNRHWWARWWARRAPARKWPWWSSCVRALKRKQTSVSRPSCRKPARMSYTAWWDTRRTPRWCWWCGANVTACATMCTLAPATTTRVPRACIPTSGCSPAMMRSARMWTNCSASSPASGASPNSTSCCNRHSPCTPNCCTRSRAKLSTRVPASRPASWRRWMHWSNRRSSWRCTMPRAPVCVSTWSCAACVVCAPAWRACPRTLACARSSDASSNTRACSGSWTAVKGQSPPAKRGKRTRLYRAVARCSARAPTGWSATSSSASRWPSPSSTRSCTSAWCARHWISRSRTTPRPGCWMPTETTGILRRMAPSRGRRRPTWSKNYPSRPDRLFTTCLHVWQDCAMGNGSHPIGTPFPERILLHGDL